MKNLLNVKTKTKVRVVSIMGGRHIRQRLAQSGIGIDSVVVVDRNAPFSGPLVIIHDGNKLVIGRGIAAAILVVEAE